MFSVAFPFFYHGDEYDYGRGRHHFLHFEPVRKGGHSSVVQELRLRRARCGTGVGSSQQSHIATQGERSAGAANQESRTDFV